MQKHTLTLFVILLMPIILMAQSYDKMWKEVEQAQQRDLPKTTLQAIDRIIATAQKHDDAAQLIKACVTRIKIASDLSSDSAQAMIPKMEAMIQSTKSPADKCVWQMVLGWCKTQGARLGIKGSKTEAIAAYREATASPATLAATPSKQYLPLVTKGDDSRYYGHDMLSVVFPFVAKSLHDISTPEADSLCREIMGKEIEWYRSHNNREATMLAKIDSVRITKHDNTSFYKSILNEYDDLPLMTEAVHWLSRWYDAKEAYNLILATLARHPNTIQTNTLKNQLSSLTQPTISCYNNTTSIYPGKTINISVSHRNIKTATLSYTRLPYAASDTILQTITTGDYKKYTATPDYQTTISLRQGEPYEQLKDTLNLCVPQPGVYIFKLSSPDARPSYMQCNVSSLAIIQLPLPEQKIKVCVVDRQNGKPVPYAQIKIKTIKGKNTLWESHDTDANGEIILPPKERTQYLYASIPGDDALDETPLAYNYTHNYKDNDTSVRIYTDRGIYRPGQTVKVGGLFYNKIEDSTSVIANTNLTLELHNATGKLLEKAFVKTDEFGSFNTDFTLPQEGMNGRFSIRSEYGSTSFKVEEYKRPKFRITIDEPTVAYTLGDTLLLSGEAKTYTGLPLANTRVYCNSVRNRSWWFFYHEPEAPVTVRDTITTDADGRFQLPVILSSPIERGSRFYPRFYTYTVTAKATADDGETEEATTYLYAGTTKAWVNTNLTDVICKEQLPDFIATQTNCMGQSVAGMGAYTITSNNDTIRTDSLCFNEKGQFDFLRTLPSGKYTISIYPTGDSEFYHSYRHSFSLISFTDTKTISNAPLQLWQSKKEFSVGDTVSILVGTPLKDTWLRYNLMTNNKVIDSRIIHISDTIIRFDYTYCKEYEKGIYANFTIYSDDYLSQQSAVITKPLPDKNLQIKWNTFRNKLQPGATEKWTMTITQNNRPVHASVLATMYDASLDKFGKHSMPFSLSFDRSIATRQWSASRSYYLNLNTHGNVCTLQEKQLIFTVFNLHDFGAHPYKLYSIKTKALAGNGMLYRDVAIQEPLAAVSKEIASEESATVSDAEPERDLTADVQIRSDFSETAFFTSSLKTNAEGEAHIEFKLPESLTSWNFMALAHTADVSYGFINELITVEKPIMVQANMPRFLRNNDNTKIAVTIINHSDQSQKGKTQLSVIDAQSGKQLSLQTLPFNLKANENTTLHFNIQASDDCPLLICKYVAVTDDFSDGEQQYLPVLSDLQETITTVPFSLTDTSAHTFDLDSLDYTDEASRSSLTVEYTGNPAWTAITALPTTLNYQSRCATQLAINYCATATMRQILANNPQIRSAVEHLNQNPQENSPFLSLENNPELKLTILRNTPWANNADRERMQLEGLAQDDKTMEIRQGLMLNKLREMQTAEGAWYWFPGMSPSTALTLDIAEMLVRTRHLCPATTAETDLIISRALSYLDRKAENEVKLLKQEKSKTISTDCMRYLYIASMTQWQQTATRKYLLNRLAQSATDYNLYSKALAACVLQATGRQKEALATMRSLMEYTVSKPEMGRYFDGRRAPSSSSMYRIPTQIAAIEAIANITPNEKTTLAEMKLWLMQSKHTQEWNNPLAASRAIQCILSTGMLNAPTALPAQMRLTTAKHLTIDLNDIATINPFIQMGYQKATLSAAELGSAPQSVTLQQSAATIEQPLSYGAVYLKNYLPSNKIKSQGSELTLTMQMFRETAGKWVAINTKTMLHKGDRIMVRYTIDATRDMDFVALNDGRAACMEPADNTSGYAFGSYRSVEDDGTTWYFDHLSKGTHTIEAQYDIDRSGTFQTACPQVQCQYAPEFTARAQNITLTVE